MTLIGRVERLEQQTTGQAPAACLVWVAGAATVVIHATGERLPYADYARRWPAHPVLKVYADWVMVDAV